jgi:hypothetical protein
VWLGPRRSPEAEAQIAEERAQLEALQAKANEIVRRAFGRA